MPHLTDEDIRQSIELKLIDDYATYLSELDFDEISFVYDKGVFTLREAKKIKEA